jgi:hypothetical protein
LFVPEHLINVEEDANEFDDDLPRIRPRDPDRYNQHPILQAQKLHSQIKEVLL